MTDLAEGRRIARALEDVSEGHDEPMEPDPHPDRTRLFRTPGFARMRTRWNSAEQEIISAAKDQADYEIDTSFADVYRIMNRLYEIVREPLHDRNTGEVVRDDKGFVVWHNDEFGMVAEDWSRLTERDKEGFLHQITTRLLTWEQRAAEMRGEALYAKAIWEERFALSFTDAPAPEGTKRPTEADRTQHAQAGAREQRYMAIYMTVRSNKADALVRSMERIAMRLKDTLV
jgi:hypothetical protein